MACLRGVGWPGRNSQVCSYLGILGAVGPGRAIVSIHPILRKLLFGTSFEPPPPKKPEINNSISVAAHTPSPFQRTANSNYTSVRQYDYYTKQLQLFGVFVGARDFSASVFLSRIFANKSCVN